MKKILVLVLAPVALALSLAVGSPDGKSESRPPIPRFKANPQWPFEMRRTGREGYVVVRFTVDEDGRTKDIVAVDASRKDFVAPAKKAVEKWRYKPALIGGVPSAVTLEEAIYFRIK